MINRKQKMQNVSSVKFQVFSCRSSYHHRKRHFIIVTITSFIVVIGLADVVIACIVITHVVVASFRLKEIMTYLLLILYDKTIN